MLTIIQSFMDFVLHLDQHLIQIAITYQGWTLLLLFTIIFCETGLVVAPFLPGDSLLFAAGAVSALEGSPVPIGTLIPLLCLAGFLGDNTNYWIGRFLGEKLCAKYPRIIKQKYLDKTHEFYEEHGGKAVIIARFMPLLRTFAPFVAGVGHMKYPRFVSFSAIGNLVWVNSFCLGGYFFGNMPIVKQNFSAVILGVIFVSILPGIITYLKAKMKTKATSKC